MCEKFKELLLTTRIFEINHSFESVKSIVTVLIERESGSLTRIISLLNRRRFSIETIAIGACERNNLERLTLTLQNESHNKEKAEQLIKQLKKLINVVEVKNITSLDTIERELCLVKIRTTPSIRKEVLELSKIFQFKVSAIVESIVTLEICEEPSKIKDIESFLQKYDILQITKSGKIALSKEPPIDYLYQSKSSEPYFSSLQRTQGPPKLIENVSKNFFMPPLIRYEFRREEGRINKNKIPKDYDKILLKYKEKNTDRPRKLPMKRCPYLWK